MGKKNSGTPNMKYVWTSAESIGSRMADLKRDADVGLTLYTQHDLPGKEKESNKFSAKIVKITAETGELKRNAKEKQEIEKERENAAESEE